MMSTLTPSDETAVFSSDGLPPIPAPNHNPPPQPPPPSKPLMETATEDDILDDGDHLHPTQAFEVFRGKAFITSEDHPRHISSNVTETPRQRMTRLRREIDELEQDLATTTTTKDDDSDSYDTDEIRNAMRELTSRLVLLSPEQLQGELSSRIRRDVNAMRRSSSTDRQTTTTTTTTSKDDVSNEETGVTYELFLGETNGNGGDLALEERMLQLERAVGGDIEISKGSILERLDSAETSLKRFDGSTLEGAASKAKLIRADLEAAAKARSKLSSSSSSMEDTQLIASLHDQMLQLESLSLQLPDVLQRLRQLATLHNTAADFANRLAYSERGVANAERLLDKVETMLERVEEGCRENLEIVERNVGRLDERLGGEVWKR